MSEMPAHPITCALFEATRQKGVSKEYLTGIVKGDTLGRFDDGALIHTSSLVEEVEPNVFKTRSGNFYRVETWYGEAAKL
jgi:hypothetical protein